ncbi:MAG: methionine--tRNA ligase subunit beta, partial [Candidatus Altiarchaeota archaeon]
AGRLDEGLAGSKIGKVTPLYRKIEDEDILSFKEKYLPPSKEGKNKKEPQKKLIEEKEMVEFEEFQKLELRIATIKEVKQHPNADKLLLLNVDVGELGERQLVAGIKERYSEKELVGRQIVVVTNLKPAQLRGEESQGMLLAADENGKPILLQPDKKVKAGTKVG